MHAEEGTAGPAAQQSETNPAPQGHSVDTHFSWLRTRMSIERTLLSWNRTCLSLIGFGFTIYQFFEKLQEAVGGAALRPEAPRNVGLAFVVAGTVGTLIALWQYRQMIAYLTGEQFRDIAAAEGLPHWSLSFAVTLFLALIGFVTIGWMVLHT